MAKKSAKNKKALRRKQEAMKRSRVVRQDYTVGGRVKAFNGLPDGVQEAIDAARKAEEEAKRKATQQVRRREDPTPSPQPMRNAQSAIPVVPKEITPVTVKETPQIMGKPTTPQEPPPRVPREVTPVIVEERPRIMDTPPTTPQIRREEPSPVVPKEITSVLRKETPETVRLPDGTILDLGTGETTDIPTTTTATPTVTTNVTTTAEDSDTTTVNDSPIVTLPVEPDDYGSRYDGKQYSAGDYDVISKSGGDKNSDNFITEEEWATWMLNKGPTPGFEEGWTKKLKEDTVRMLSL